MAHTQYFHSHFLSAYSTFSAVNTLYSLHVFGNLKSVHGSP